MKCKKILSNNQQCRAFSQTGSDLCFRHDPMNDEAKMLASSKGGRNRALQDIYGVAVKLDTPDDIKEFLGKVINGVWSGEVPVPVGSSMGFLTRCWLDAYEVSDTLKRLEKIEDKLDNINSM